jgi:dinuclear metal center YbgI/SA1388 family protein
MALSRTELELYLNEYFDIANYQDYGPNGLQVEGTEEIKKIAYAVSATRESVAKAIELNADALIVHHGLFWKFHGPKTITKAFAKRVIPLIKNDINLFGFHLPLDGHTEVGNAVALANRLEMKDLKPFGDYKKCPTGTQGNLTTPLKASEFKKKLEKVLNHSVIVSSPDESALIENIGIITGGANGDWVEALNENLDAYITGEISEHDWHEAKESDIHFFAGGHNATEQFGIQDLLKHLHEKYSDFEVEHFFIPSSNPA